RRNVTNILVVNGKGNEMCWCRVSNLGSLASCLNPANCLAVCRKSDLVRRKLLVLLNRIRRINVFNLLNGEESLSTVDNDPVYPRGISDSTIPRAFLEPVFRGSSRSICSARLTKDWFEGIPASNVVWPRKITEWQIEEQQVLMARQGSEQPSPDRLLSAKKTLELANLAYFQYLTQNPLEQGTLLKKVLLNC